MDEEGVVPLNMDTEQFAIGRENGTIISKSKLYEFSQAVKYISVEKMEAVRAIGFGYTLHLGCTDLVQPIVEATVKYVDPVNYKILIHGIVCYINGEEFGRVMGIHDGGEPIILGEVRAANDYGNAVGPMCDADGKITVELLSDIVCKRREVDDTFKIAFAMLALTCVICPGTDDAVDVRKLLPLMDTTRIVRKNWASFAVKNLMEGVKRHRAEGSRVVGGCMIFLQLLYLDKVGEVLTPDKDRLDTPIIYWETHKVQEIVNKIRLTGGHKSPTVMLKKSKRTKRLQDAGYECGDKGFGLRRDVHETIMDLQVDVNSMKHRMWDMKLDVSRMQPRFVELTEGVNMVVHELRETLSVIKGQCQTMCKQKLGLERPHTEKFGKMENGVNKGEEYEARKGMHEVVMVGNNNCSGLLHMANKKGDRTVRVNEKAGVGSELSCSPTGKQCMERENKVCTAEIIRQGLKRSHASAMFGELSDYKGYASILKEKVGLTQAERGVMIRYGAGPYRLKVKLPEAEVRIIESVYLRGKILTVEEGRCCLGSCGNGAQSICRDEINCLLPKTNICGSVINYVVAYLNKEGGSNWYWSTHFESRAQSSEGKRFTQWVAHTRRVCGLHKFDGMIDNCERIFLPVHEGSTKNGHWILIVVDMAKKAVEVWDSGPGPVLNPERMEKVLQVLRHIDRVMWFDNITQPGSMIMVEKFTIVEPANVPKQGNCYDCGVYVIQNMQHYRTHWAKEYDSEEQRAAILVACLVAPNNELDASLGDEIIITESGVDKQSSQLGISHKNRTGKQLEEWKEGEEGEYWRRHQTGRPTGFHNVAEGKIK